MEVQFENWDSKKHKFVPITINLSKEPTVEDFLNKTGLDKYLLRVGTIVKNQSVKCGYKTEIDPLHKQHEQWAYVLTIDGRIVKFGDTTKTLQHRWGSYSAGTKENRERGTCSTTNFFISEFIRKALDQNIKVELWGYKIPNKVISIDVFGESKEALCDFVTYYESNLLKMYKETYNKLPVLGKNGLTND